MAHQPGCTKRPSHPGREPEAETVVDDGQAIGEAPAEAAGDWSLTVGGMTLQDRGHAFAVEICAGSARLTTALAAVGFDAVGIDWQGNKDKAEGPVVEIDLATTEGEAILEKILTHPRLAYVHFAPPCGTASRARERRIPGLRGGGPPPLRSADHPRGVPDLEVHLPRAARKVRSANLIYDLVARFARELCLRQVPWTLENPWDSLFWYLANIIDLLSYGAADIFFQHCMHGGERDKKTRLRAFPPTFFESLAAMCSRDHTHKPWGVDTRTGEFATAGERVYPHLLCSRLAAAAAAAAASTTDHPLASPSRQTTFPTSLPQHVPPALPPDGGTGQLSRVRAAAARQPRGCKTPHIVPMFKERRVMSIMPVHAPMVAAVVGQVLHDDLVVGDVCVPSGARISQVMRDGGSTGPGDSTPSRVSFADWRRDGFPTDGYMYIGRAHRTSDGRCFPESQWANPFRVADYGREGCLTRYGDYFVRATGLTKDLPTLAGKQLVCHCATDQACHADILIDAFLYQVAGAARLNLLVDMPWSWQEFVEVAMRAEHPFAPIACDRAIWRSAFLLATRGPKAMVELRLKELVKWKVRARELEPAETKLHGSLHPDVRGSVGRKRLHLLREMLKAADFPCADLIFDSMVGGFSVFGEVRPTGVFPEFRRPPAASEATLEDEAPAARRALRASPPPSHDDDLLCRVYEETTDEVQRGWLRGPLTEEDLDLKFKWWIPSRRFGVRQGEKVRAVDDYSIYGHNECTGTSERIDVGGVDNVVSIARCLMQVLGPDSAMVEVSLPDGDLCTGPRSSDLGPCVLRGKLWDLSKAYRQLPRTPSQAHASIVAVFNLGRSCWEFFEQLALPFGATAAVYHFNLVARGIQTILVRLFGICCCHYFDDFPVIEHATLCNSAQFIIDQLLELLGWDTKEQVPFDAVFEPLGVVVDLSGSRDGTVCVRNKESRVAELEAAVADARSSGDLSAHEARRLRGRFVFSRSQAFGRCGAPSLRLLGALAEARRPRQHEVADAIAALSRLGALLRSAPSRLVRASLPMPVLIFVDGACDPGESLPAVGVGACIFDEGEAEYFGEQAGLELVGVWADRPDQQVIAQAELVPVLMAIETWCTRLRGRPVVVFIDNDAARFGLISGYSPVVASAAIISAAWAAIAKLGAYAWFARVPTVCNPADGPSRAKFAEMASLPRSRRVEPVCFERRGEEVWPALAATLRAEASGI